MYAGQFVETGTTEQVFNAPSHPYTQGLLRCIPDSGQNETRRASGRHPRHRSQSCRQDRRAATSPAAVLMPIIPVVPVTSPCVPRSRRSHEYRCVLPPKTCAANLKARECGMSDPVIEASDVTRTFMISAGFMRGKQPLHAVNGISLNVERGEVLGLVGESGCGKTTLAKMMLGLLEPTSGTLSLDGKRVGAARQDRSRPHPPTDISGPLFLAQSAQVHRRHHHAAAEGAGDPTPIDLAQACRGHYGPRRPCRSASTTISQTSFPVASASASPLPAR